MCGIAGGISDKALDAPQLNAVLDSIEHRGPDERGTFVQPGIALGMCRLAIIDVGTGQQPVSDQSDTIQLVLNGEIYNFLELRAGLVAKGHIFRSKGDAEVLVHLYQEYGLDFVQKISGMFAVAIWDSRDGSLTLIRDRMGKKPLWYAHSASGGLIFASEVKALLRAGVTTTLRKDAISEVMTFGYVNSPRSSFNEIQQLPPASLGVWRNGSWSVSKYWSLDFSREEKIPYEEAKERTEGLIRAAVERRLISERPLGSFLSGGIDSTVVTAYMTQLVPGQVKTYSIGFTDPRYDESKYARAISDHLGTDHVEEILTPDPAFVLEQITATLDQPFADSSIIPTYMLAKFAREQVVVALGGDGGDEVFGGYDRYLATPTMQRLNPLMALTSPLAKRVGAGTSNRKLKRLLSQVAPHPSLASRYRSVMSLASEAELSQVISPAFLNFYEPRNFEAEFARAGARDDLSKMLRSDVERYLPGDLLVKADLATMANSLELRSPLLDHEVVEWMTALPSNYKVRGRTQKFMLKEIAYSLVPKKLIDRPKMGFAIPRADWLRTGLRDMSHDLLTDERAKSRGWFNTLEVKAVLADHMAGRDRDSLIWPMLMIELWARKWLDR